MTSQQEFELVANLLKVALFTKNLKDANEKLVKEVGEMKETIAKLTAGANTTFSSVKGDFAGGTSHGLAGFPYIICGSSATVPDNASVVQISHEIKKEYSVGGSPATVPNDVDVIHIVPTPSGVSLETKVEFVSSLPSVASETALLPSVVECQFCFSSHPDGECVYQLWMPVLAKSEPEVRPVRKFIRVIKNKWVIVLPKGSYPVIVGWLNEQDEIQPLHWEDKITLSSDPDLFSLKLYNVLERDVIKKVDPKLFEWITNAALV